MNKKYNYDKKSEYKKMIKKLKINKLEEAIKEDVEWGLSDKRMFMI